MIRDSELALIGRMGKPHGVNGEINASLLYDTLAPEALRCIVVKIDGINVPFFLDSVRPKGRESVLLHIEGISTEKAAASMANKDFYALRAELPSALDKSEAEEAEGEGLYAADLVGFRALTPDGQTIGTIDGINDDTVNVLFEITGPEGKEILVPVADEFISDIDMEARTITLDLPEGIL